MKKLLLAIFMGVLLMTGCSEKKPNPNLANLQLKDSLSQIINQKDSEIDSMMSTMNMIEVGFREINEAENRVSIAKDGEGANKTQQIRENIKFISSKMKQNKELIAKLQKQLRSSSFKGSKLKETIENLTKQLEEKDKQLQDLRVELDAKDIHITELDETINNLITTAGNLSADNEAKSSTISSQDKQLNTAWFAYGTKQELKEQEILIKGKVLQGTFNKTYFTKIDIRTAKEIKLYSKSAKMLTIHPSSSYALTPDANKQYVLRILNPQLFWSTSKYLVILVK